MKRLKIVLMSFGVMMLSVTAFANNANGEKGVVTDSEQSVVRSVAEERTIPLVMKPNQIETVPIPLQEGYKLEDFTASIEDSCVEYETNARSLYIKITARRNGTAIFRFVLVAIDGGPTIVININVNVDDSYKKE